MKKRNGVTCNIYYYKNINNYLRFMIFFEYSGNIVCISSFKDFPRLHFYKKLTENIVVKKYFSKDCYGLSVFPRPYFQQTFLFNERYYISQKIHVRKSYMVKFLQNKFLKHNQSLVKKIITWINLYR